MAAEPDPVKGGSAADPASVAVTLPAAEKATAAPAKPSRMCCGCSSSLIPFAVVSTCYLLYTTTDGAIRMIVLLHAYQLGFSAWETALMFSLYELAGVATNLVAGFMGDRWGIRSTLLAGLTIQLAGIGMLFRFDHDWAASRTKAEAVVYVTMAQMLCGIAKDLTKLGGKTVTKLVTPDDKQSKLFKLVAFITGMKNSMKGIGYFIGSISLTVHYFFALALLLFLILIALPLAFFFLSDSLGRARSKNVTWRQILSPPSNVSKLSLARSFLFGARDLWFEVPLPFFLRSAAWGLGWPRPATGAALAAFIIIYGQVQSWTPQLVLTPLKQMPANKHVQVFWNSLLTIVPSGMAAAVLGSGYFSPRHEVGPMTALLMAGLAVFCVVFAVNSSIHSYLIVRYSGGDKVASSVGFYYMSNAAGRFVGTLCSGAIYQYAADDKALGLGYCFVVSAGFSLISTLLTTRIDDSAAGLRFGRFVCAEPHGDGGAGAFGGDGSAEGEKPKKVKKEGGNGAAAGAEEGAATSVQVGTEQGTEQQPASAGEKGEKEKGDPAATAEGVVAAVADLAEDGAASGAAVAAAAAAEAGPPEEEQESARRPPGAEASGAKKGRSSYSSR